jgi:hypothetical protein
LVARDSAGSITVIGSLIHFVLVGRTGTTVCPGAADEDEVNQRPNTVMPTTRRNPERPRGIGYVIF